MNPIRSALERIPLLGFAGLMLPALAQDDIPTGIELAGLRPLKGDRTITPPVEPPPEAAPREWFGQPTPWWQWKRMTGDWGGGRSALEDRGLELGGDYTFDWSAPFASDLNQRGYARGLLDAHLTFDPKPLLGIQGGQLFFQYYYRHGPDACQAVQDIQGFDNVDAERLSKVEEFWYEQKLFGDRLRLKAGQVDANAEFDFVESAAEFLLASAGYSPTLLGMPTYPDPRLGFNAFVYPADEFYIGAGVYGPSMYHGTGFRHPFYIGELGFTKAASERSGAGRIAIGAHYSDESLERCDGTPHEGTGGLYAVAEQTVWREDSTDAENEQAVTVFGQYGFAEKAVSPVVHHLAVGVQSVGLLPGRDGDIAGLRSSLAIMTRETGSPYDANELNLECFYQFRVTPFLALKPDLQWIHNPGGTAYRSDALVFTLRATLEF